MQLVQQIRRIFIEEQGGDGLGKLPVFGFGAEQQQRQIRNFSTDLGQQGGAGVLHEPPVAGNARIGDDPHQERLISPIEFSGFLEAGGQQDLGPRAHPQQPMLLVETDAEHRLGLAHDLLVDQGQKGRVVTR